MTFEKALDQAFKKLERSNPHFKGAVTPEGMEAVALAWNMIAIAIAEKGLDDFVIINNNKLISIPLKPLKVQEKPEDDENNTKSDKGKGKSPKQATATNDKVDVKQKETKTDSE